MIEFDAWEDETRVAEGNQGCTSHRFGLLTTNRVAICRTTGKAGSTFAARARRRQANLKRDNGAPWPKVMWRDR